MFWLAPTGWLRQYVLYSERVALDAFKFITGACGPTGKDNPYEKRNEVVGSFGVECGFVAQLSFSSGSAETCAGCAGTRRSDYSSGNDARTRRCAGPAPKRHLCVRRFGHEF